jgi:CheY-like chemotaxis protein
MAVILIVDDEWGIARLLEDVLTDEGHTVMVASNGRQALEHAVKQRPAVVVTDFMMPVMNGAELIDAMSAMPDLAGIPVIVMSSMPEDVIAERTTGYIMFVRKPFRIFEVIDLVAELVLSGERTSPNL